MPANVSPRGCCVTIPRHGTHCACYPSGGSYRTEAAPEAPRQPAQSTHSKRNHQTLLRPHHLHARSMPRAARSDVAVRKGDILRPQRPHPSHATVGQSMDATATRLAHCTHVKPPDPQPATALCHRCRGCCLNPGTDLEKPPWRAASSGRSTAQPLLRLLPLSLLQDTA